MDNRIAIGDKLELEKIDTRLSVNPDRKPEVYVSQVLDEGEFGNIFVAMPIQEGKMIPLTVGQEFWATFYTKKSGLLHCRVSVAGRYKRDSLFFMELEFLTVLEKTQRREYFRFECRTEIYYRILSEEEQKIVESTNVYDIDETKVEWKSAVMLDLSGGGIHFISHFEGKKGSLVQVRFEIGEDEELEIIYAFAKIMRMVRNQNNSAIYDYHIEFWRMDKNRREKIIGHIFEQQRKNRSKQLGNG